MASSFQIVPQTRTSRTPRRPQHTFNVDVRPWQIVPFFIAPVIPGETMKNLLLQARVVTDPIKNPLTGWWCEFYVFYVKHRDLDDTMRTPAVNMMIDPSVTMPVVGAQDWDYFTFNGGVSWLRFAVLRIVQTYFRDENEQSATFAIGSYHASQISQQTFLDSALLESAYTAGAPSLVVGVDDTITGQELDQTWLLWQQYRSANLTHMSYEEYLSTYGIPLPQGSESSRRPELVRFVRDWSYPTNTVDPVTGTPTSAVSWAIAERADKDRFFREPGFLVGVTCIRPKVYLKTHYGTVTGGMKDALSWLPAVLGDNPEYSIRKFTPAAGPLSGIGADYRIDLKDLLLYGEQYINYNPSTAATKNMVSLPSTTLGKKYPSDADADAMFKAPASNMIHMDGIVSLNILGQQIETTPTAAPGGF